MANRKVHINSKEWQYYIGRSNTKILSPENKNYIVPHHKILEISFYDYERGIHKKNIHITPSVIKNYITSYIMNK